MSCNSFDNSGNQQTDRTIPMVDDSSTIIPSTSNINESFGRRLGPESNKTDVPRSPVRV
jgi:hypothetical protein